MTETKQVRLNGLNRTAFKNDLEEGEVIIESRRNDDGSRAIVRINESDYEAIGKLFEE